MTMIERERRGLADNGVRWSKTETTNPSAGEQTMTIETEALARIDAVLSEVFRDAALSEFERVDPEETYESLVPKANALASALRAARAEIVRLSALVPEPPTGDVPGGCIYCKSSGVVEDYEGDRPCSACKGTGTPTDERASVRKENGPLSIERLREIGNAATPSPWTYDGYGADEPEINAWAHRYIRSTEADASGLYREIATSEDGHGPNAEFIVHARNFWDELLDELAMWRNRGCGPITDDEREALLAKGFDEGSSRAFMRRYPPRNPHRPEAARDAGNTKHTNGSE